MDRWGHGRLRQLSQFLLLDFGKLGLELDVVLLERTILRSRRLQVDKPSKKELVLLVELKLS